MQSVQHHTTTGVNSLKVILHLFIAAETSLFVYTPSYTHVQLSIRLTVHADTLYRFACFKELEFRNLYK